MQLNTAYKLRVRYINAVRDGAVVPGQVVTYTSDEFNIVDPGVDCSAKKTTLVSVLPPSMLRPPPCLSSLKGLLRLRAPDPIGLPTVGYGSQVHEDELRGSSFPPSLFPLQTNASLLLTSDLKAFISCVNANIADNVTLDDNQTGALSAFAFKVGCATLGTSSLLARLNDGEDPDTAAGEELPGFDRANGAVLLGLTNRRAAEVELFQTASAIVAHPCI
jgi:GH24 family phage-related lysozyme (muramidase)